MLEPRLDAARCAAVCRVCCGDLLRWVRIFGARYDAFGNFEVLRSSGLCRGKVL